MPHDLKQFVRKAIRSLLTVVLEDDIELDATVTVVVLTSDRRRRLSRTPAKVLLKRDGTVLVTVRYGKIVEGFLTRGDTDDGGR